jgi:hypothetical protein
MIYKKNSELRSQNGLNAPLPLTELNSGRLGNEYWFKTLPLVGKKKLKYYRLKTLSLYG